MIILCDIIPNKWDSKRDLIAGSGSFSEIPNKISKQDMEVFLKKMRDSQVVETKKSEQYWVEQELFHSSNPCNTLAYILSASSSRPYNSPGDYSPPPSQPSIFFYSYPPILIYVHELSVSSLIYLLTIYQFVGIPRLPSLPSSLEFFA